MTGGGQTFELLLVDHDGRRAHALRRALERAGHRVSHCASGGEAVRAVDGDHFDAMIVERELPRFDGVAVVEALREGGCTKPIVLLSDLGDTASRIRGLEAGADDYIVRPALPREIVARLAAVIRGRGWATAASDSLRVGDIRISPARHRAWRGGRALDLSRTELGLLTELARHVDSVLTRPVLSERVWGGEGAPSNVIDVFVRRLRQKLAEEGPVPIVTVRGIGYMMRSPAGAA